MGYNFQYKKFLSVQKRKPILKNLPLPWVNASHTKSTYRHKTTPSQQIYQHFPHCANYFFEANEPPKIKYHHGSFQTQYQHAQWLQLGHVVGTSTRILNCWDVIKGEVVLLLTTPPTYQLLTQPMATTQTNAALLVEELAAWNNKNSIALGVIQGKTSLAIWPEFMNHAEAATLWAALETKCGKARGSISK